MDWYQRVIMDQKAQNAKKYNDPKAKQAGSNMSSGRASPRSSSLQQRNRTPIKGKHMRWFGMPGPGKPPNLYDDNSQDNWADRADCMSPSGKFGSRPNSVASTRCPSSASTMKRAASPRSLCSSPFGDQNHATFGNPFNRTRSPVQTVSEAWSGIGPPGHSSADRSASPQGDRVGPGSGDSSPREPEEEVEIPNWYREQGSSTEGVALLPDWPLYISLKGGNGLWEKRKAIIEWRHQLAEHRESEVKRISALKMARKAKIEADLKVKVDRDWLQRRVEEDAIARKQRMIAEQEEALRLRLEQEDLKRINKEKKATMFISRPCKICTGSGKCIPCTGKGCTMTLFLATTVNEEAQFFSGEQKSKTVCGQLPRGCAPCGGSGDGAWWGEFIPGSGYCQSCGGKGQVPAPPNGWPDCQ